MRYFFILGRTPDLSVLEIVNFANMSPALTRVSLPASPSLGGKLERSGRRGRRIKIANVARMSETVLTVETEKEIDISELMQKLGGVVKAGKIVDIQQIKAPACRQAGIIADFLEKNIDKEKKFYFGFSAYGQHLNIKTFKHKNRPSTELRPRKLKDLGLEVKKILKKRGVKSRFVTSKDAVLSSVVVKKNKLVSDCGIELVFMSGDGNDMIHDGCNIKHATDADVLIGETLAVQEFESFSLRDYGRPCRDMKVGMLPPKLARMMINISGMDNDKVILDPFCGGGTVLQELLLLGYKNIIGNDISKEMIDNTKANLAWLDAKYIKKQEIKKIEIRDEELVKSHEAVPDDSSLMTRPTSPDGELDSGQANDYKLYNEDVTKLSNVLPKNSIDAIVTEPHMGPALTGRESEEKLARIMEELSELYIKTFREFKKVLKNGGVVVMVWPVFCRTQIATHLRPAARGISARQVDNGYSFIHVDIMDEIKKMGFRSVLEKDSQNLVDISERGSVLYMREGQRVGREVFKFRVSH